MHDPIALDYVVRVFGSKRVLLGTDYPFPMGDQDPVGFIRSLSSLSAEQQDDILGDNAARLFGL